MSRVVLQEEIIDRVYKNLSERNINIYKKDIRDVFNTLFREIRDALSDDCKVRINDFAVISAYKARPSRVVHPVSGKVIGRNIKSKKVRFSPIGEFKEDLKIDDKKREGDV